MRQYHKKKKKLQVVSVRVPTAEKRRWARIAEARGWTISQLIREKMDRVKQ